MVTDLDRSNFGDDLWLSTSPPPQHSAPGVYSDDLGTDAEFWRTCAQERGDGYRNKVNRHNARWFEADPGKEADERVVDLIALEWTKTVAGVKELMPTP